MKNNIADTFIAKPHLIAFCSFPIYFLFSNILLNLWRIVFYQYFRFEWIGIYCKADGLPNVNLKLLAYLFLLFLSKYAVIIGGLRFLVNKNKQYKLVVSLVLVDLLLMDGVGLFFYFVNDYLAGFECFLAGSQIYMLDRELGLPLWFSPLLNFIAGNSLLVYVLNIHGRFSIKEIAVHYMYLMSGVLIFVSILELMIIGFL